MEELKRASPAGLLEETEWTTISRIHKKNKRNELHKQFQRKKQIHYKYLNTQLNLIPIIKNQESNSDYLKRWTLSEIYQNDFYKTHKYFDNPNLFIDVVEQFLIKNGLICFECMPKGDKGKYVEPIFSNLNDVPLCEKCFRRFRRIKNNV